MCKFLHHLSRYCIALHFIFPAFTLSPTFSNFRSSLQQMEPMPSQVRNHYSQKNQEAHLERVLTFRKAANLHCPSKDRLPIYPPSWNILGMTNIPNFINQSGWQDQSGDRWWQQWGHQRVHLIIRHRRRWFGSSTGGSSSRSGAPGHVITHYKRSTAKEIEPCQ